MKPLDKALRSQLEKTVREARDVSETAARIALNQLGVAEAAPFSYQSESERELRRKLRVHGRQLGDALNGGQQQSMDRLIEEVAYEHWHRMLFARFLVENNLLMYPDPVNPVPITLDECQDLAAKEDAKNGWELAARFAANMLPQIFRLNSPVFQLCLPPENQQELEKLIDGLPSEVFKASDSLGWVYQFWQAKKKDEVNSSEVKIGARELPAVTQLFTEDYMVTFLLDNSIGAWWASQRLCQKDFESSKNEDELREKASLPDVPLDYLRFAKDGENCWTPAAGKFESWPKSLAQFKIMDPCCGSGHFLVAAFQMLVSMRMEMEKLSAKDATDAVLKDNLYGLEIDRRCVELAAFAVAFAAWRYPNAGGYRQLPRLNIACSGLSINAKEEEWLELVGSNENLRYIMQQFYKEFKHAPILGSLINPKMDPGKEKLLGVEWNEILPLLTKALSADLAETAEMGVVAQGIATAAVFLGEKYDLVTTNVPYLARGKQCDFLRNYSDIYYSSAKHDLATTFLNRCLELCHDGCTCSMVLPQNWLFLISYSKFREEILRKHTCRMIARLGPGAFETISGEVVKAILFVASHGKTRPENLCFKKTSQQIGGLDVSGVKTTRDKAKGLAISEIIKIDQTKQLENPDARISFGSLSDLPLLSEYANSYQGIKTGDDPKLKRFFWEIAEFNKWKYTQGGSLRSGSIGFSFCLNWVAKKGFARLQGLAAIGRRGLVITTVNKIISQEYFGDPFTSEVVTLIPHDEKYLSAIRCYCESLDYETNIRQIDQNLAVSTASLVKVPFDYEHWTEASKRKYSKVLGYPCSSDPTQWVFPGHPVNSSDPLQVSVMRLLGYRWPAEFDKSVELSEEGNFWVKKTESLLSYADEDGIVCLPSVRGEMKAEDQLENLIAAAYGVEWSSAKRSELLAKADCAEKTLGYWLREKFFSQHCKLFFDRPLIWYLWDGLNDGFAALINYHKLDRKLLETLIYTYLGDWISRQKQNKAQGIDGSEEKLASAVVLKRRLELILEGEKPYDIFVRWKPLEEQPVGWNPDLNDGVRVNIRPFMSVPDVGKKGAGILRDKPNIEWGKDRGRDIESAPWFNLGPMFAGKEGDRINDHHLSLDEKLKARKLL